MRRHALAALLLTALTLSLSVPSSHAHVVTSTTGLSRFKVPAGPTERGERIVIAGRLKASDPACYAGIEVQLFRTQATGEKLLARDVTDSEGEYLFQRRPRRSQGAVVRFAGFTTSVQDHSHACAASASRALSIKVQR